MRSADEEWYQTADRLARIMVNVQNETFGRLSHEERATLIELLDRLGRP
jgi:hypothetical protein